MFYSFGIDFDEFGHRCLLKISQVFIINLEKRRSWPSSPNAGWQSCLTSYENHIRLQNKMLPCNLPALCASHEKLHTSCDCIGAHPMGATINCKNNHNGRVVAAQWHCIFELMDTPMLQNRLLNVAIA